MPSNEQPSAKAEQGGQPERRLAIFLNSKPVAAARLPLSFGGRRRADPSGGVTMKRDKTA